MVDIDEFSIHELDVMRGLRYVVPPIIYYHFGLNPLGNDDNIHNFAQYVSDHKLMRVYTKHGETNYLPTLWILNLIVQIDEINENYDNKNPRAEV